MYDFLSLVGAIFLITGIGMLIILVLALMNNQMSLNWTGNFFAVFPFMLIVTAIIILFRRRKT